MTNIARDGAPKKLAPIRTHDGIFRIQNGQMLRAGNGGAPLNNETAPKSWEGKQVPVHPGMGSATPQHRSKPGDGFSVLADAANLSLNKRG
jgi:hypothetical protein